MKVRIYFNRNNCNGKYLTQQDYEYIRDIRLFEDKVVLYPMMREEDRNLNIKDCRVIPKNKIASIEIDFKKRDLL